MNSFGRRVRDLEAEGALRAFLAGALLAGALGIVVGWALASAAGIIDSPLESLGR